MRFGIFVLAAVLAGAASASYDDDLDDRSARADALSLHRRIRALHRLARRAQPSCPANGGFEGTTVVSSPMVVCPKTTDLGTLSNCAV